ncbi:FBN3 [Branchiostoma lanceolatum]|uniref:FBN3 protein n=1 Tax=Branchiostoma lanceolatum TaxID=7740 RepID=A0A8J9YTD0_BRALA|nr:FBN3 [Branchiostoma lanceolatum]
MEKLATFMLIVVCSTYVEGQAITTQAPNTTIATTNITTTAAAATTNAATNADTTAMATTVVVTTKVETTAQQTTATSAQQTSAAAAATTAAASTAGAAVSTAGAAASTAQQPTAAAATTASGSTAAASTAAESTAAASTAAESTAAASTAAESTAAGSTGQQSTAAAATTAKKTTVMATTTPLITTTEVDLCLTDPCQHGGNCTKVTGGYMCDCTGTGYMGKDCTEDVDECVSGDHMCDGNATCANTVGNYTCSCNSGYRGDGMNCTDINECNEMSDNCHEMATCHNDPGSFHCDCNMGQKGNGTYCEDVNECDFGIDACDDHAVCSNTDGNYTCTCIAGHDGDGFNCTDVDECSVGTDDCHDHATCVNTEGSFTCECKVGYTRNGTECVDVDECFLGLDTCQFICDNTDGFYTCRCPDDYILQPDNATCVLNGTCPVTCNDPAYCVVGENSTCACPEGYVLESGVNCEDINECLNSTLNMCDPLSGTCVNKDGGYSCECDAGFTLQADGTTCQDNDECTDLCKNGDCTNVPGSFNCTCHAGYKYNPTTQNCEDVNECEEQSIACGENQKCENLIGNYTCKCLQGFYRKGENCYKATHTFAGQIEFQDTFTPELGDRETTAFRDKKTIVEADLNKPFSLSYPDTFKGTQVTAFSSGSVIAHYDLLFAVPPGQDTTLTAADLSTELKNQLRQSCTMVNGESLCQLGSLSGVNLTATRVQDLNECASPDSYQCPANTDCVNTDGGYRCECSAGYQVDPNVPVIDGKQFCTELDPCESNPCDGSGYCYLKTDRTHECKACPCQNGGTCVTIPRGDNYHYTCRCPGGYSGDECGSQTVFFIATIACGAGAGLFLIILVIVAVCACCRRKDKSQSNGALHHGVESYGDGGWRPGKLRANFDVDKHMEMQETEPKHRLSVDEASGGATTFGSGHANKAATGDDGKQLDMDYF